MRAITKGPEPAKLQAHRAVPGATYGRKEIMPIKGEIRVALLRDQHALCCYCMRPISNDERAHPTNPEARPLVQMKIEHWRSQSAHSALQLIWSNLLGSCLGGIGVPPRDQTCDTRKGGDEITLDPLNFAHISTLYCTSAGHLSSTNPQFQNDIDERLGLNHRVLVADRKARLQRDLNRLLARHPNQSISESAVQQAIVEVETATDGKLPDLACVLRLWAQKRFGTLVL